MANSVFYIMCLAVLGYLPAVGAIYYGGGRIINSYGDTYLFHRGIMIAYRPENVARFSQTSSGDVALAKIKFAQDYTYSAAQEARESIDIIREGHVLSYTASGRYFYYKDELGTDLEIGQYLSLEVEFYDRFGETIYRDSGTYATPHANYCKLDVQGSKCDCTDKCSEWFDNDSYWTSGTETSEITTTFGQPANGGDTPIMPSLDDKGVQIDDKRSTSSGMQAVYIVVPLIVVIIIVAALVVGIIRRQRTTTIPSNTAQSARHGGGGGQINPVMIDVSSEHSYYQTSVNKPYREYETVYASQNQNVYESIASQRVPARPPQPPQRTAQSQQYPQQSPYNRSIDEQEMSNIPSQPQQEAQPPPYSYNYPYEHQQGMSESSTAMQPPQLETQSSVSCMYVGPEASAPQEYDDSPVTELQDELDQNT